MLNKLNLLSSLRVYLFDGCEAALVIRLNVIHEDQAKLVPNSEVGFTYKNQKYTRYPNIAPIHKHRVKALHNSLYIPMEEYLSKLKAFETEWYLISSYLQCVLNQCVSTGQLYWYLPIGLHGFIQSLGYEASIEEFGDIDIGNNQQGKELLITRLMLNMTGD